MKKFLTSLTSLTLLCSFAFAQEREGKRDRPAAQQKVNWDQIEKRIESAVERGDLTRDQANAKYKEIKKQLASRDQLQERDGLPREAQMKDLLSHLVEHKQISREVAGKIYQLAFEGREEHPLDGKGHQHLEKLAGELERLIERAKHELEAIEGARRNINGEHRNPEREQAREQSARQHAETQRREAMERAEAAQRQQLELRNNAEMQEKRMMEERKKQAEARERAEKEEEKSDKEKKHEKEEKKERK